MEIDYIWTDGTTETRALTLEWALFIYKTKKIGKVWRRCFNDGFLERVTDITPIGEI